jgi:predicted RNA binding protein YcfA (HicA-like mRNA interferase family)
MNVQKLKERLLAGWLPSELPVDDVIALYEDAGWTHQKMKGGSHHKFSKPGKRPATISVHGRKVERVAIRTLVKALKEVES